ncbi:MAG TPA: sigma-70 family RNA polymerase sigma factor [Phenylobacterium sp.]|jgi:RNA polymerase sigma-70 factor (ECF subfamily)|nr:sigma-70 family RNA polymerase sigma factor [Phenylobacterium sp.]
MQDAIALIEPIIPALRRYAFSLVGPNGDADDLVQDCLERAIGRWGQRRVDGEVRTWLFSILHNLAVSRFRRTRRRGLGVALEDAPASALATLPAQEDVVRRRDLLRALGQLSEDQRSVLLLVSVEDLTYAQAARVLGLPLGTVMSRLSRARESLRKLMEGQPAKAARPALKIVK